MISLTKIDVVVLVAGPLLGLLIGYLLGGWRAAARLNEQRLAVLRKQEVIDGLKWEMTCAVAGK